MVVLGIAPPRVDHIFLTCENVTEVTAFYRDVLDFRLTEQILGDDGFQLASWLEVSNTSHDLALVTGPDGGFHHLAYWVDDWNGLREAADVCAYHGVSVETNPTKHGATRGYCLYFFDPAGNRNETFAGGYRCFRDRPTVVWTPDQLGKAIFYHSRELNERFLTVAT